MLISCASLVAEKINTVKRVIPARVARIERAERDEDAFLDCNNLSSAARWLPLCSEAAAHRYWVLAGTRHS
jgi:hypothetical protein